VRGGAGVAASNLVSLRELETTVRSALTDIIDAAEEAVPNGPRAGAIVVPT
jgi:hypothetical protein